MMALLVAKNEFIRSLKNKKKLILMILVPLISILVAIGANSLIKPSINIGVVGNENKINYLKEQLKNINEIKIAMADKDTINTDMILSKYLVVVDFKEDNNFQVYSLDKNLKTSMEGVVSDIVTTGKTTILREMLKELGKGGLSVAQRSSGFIFITLMLTCITVASTIIKDKEDGLLRRFATSSNKISIYILGNFIYNLINTTLQVTISMLLIKLFKINVGIPIGKILIVGLVISIIATSIATLISVISNSELQASLVTSALALIMSLFGGAFLPIDKMPNGLKFISNMSITKWIINFTGNIENGILFKENFIMLIASLVVSITIIAASMKVGEKRFKTHVKY